MSSPFLHLPFPALSTVNTSYNLVKDMLLEFMKFSFGIYLRNVLCTWNDNESVGVGSRSEKAMSMAT